MLRDFILPASETNAPEAKQYEQWAGQPLPEDIYDSKLVSMTTKLPWAVYYAACHRSKCGWVYEVEVGDDIEPDECPEWFRCARARIVRRVPVSAAEMAAM